MGAGDRIASAALKVAQKVPGSDKVVSLKADSFAAYDPATESKPAASTATLATIGQACDVRNLSVQKAIAILGSYKAGDREFLVPGPAVTEANLATSGAYLVYGTEVLDLVRWEAHDISFSVVTEWRLIGRVRGI